MLPLENIQGEKRQHMSFRPQRWHTFPTGTTRLLVRSLCHNLPQMGQKIYIIMLVPFHDTMPSFMNFRRDLDLQELKNQVSQCLWPSQDAEMFEIHSHFLHGT